MKHEKAIRWKKITALLLSVSMAMSFVPGVVYADTVNDGSIVENNFNINTLSGGNEGGETNAHVHKYGWSSNENGENSWVITGSCSENGCSDNKIITCTVSMENLVYTESPEEDRYVKIVSGNHNLTLAELNELGIELTYSIYVDGKESTSQQPGNAGTYYYKVKDKINNQILLEGTFTIERAKGNADREVVMENYKCGAGVSGPSLSNISGIKGQPEYYYYKGEAENPGEKLENVTLTELPIGDYWVEARYELESDPNHYYVTAKKKFQVEDHVHEWSYKKNEETGTVTAKCDGAGNCGNRTVELKLKVTETSEYEAGQKEKRVKVVSSNGSEINLDTLAITPVFTYKDAVSGEVKGSVEPTDAGKYTYEVTFNGKESVSLNGTFTIERAKGNADREVVMENYKCGAVVSGPSLSKTEDIEGEPGYYYYRGTEESSAEKLENVTLEELSIGDYWVEARYELKGDPNHYYVTAKKKFQVEDHVHEWSYKKNEETGTVTATCDGTGKCESKTAELKLKVTEISEYEAEPKEKRVRVVSSNDSSIDLDTLAITPVFTYKDAESGETKGSAEPTDAGKYIYEVTFNGKESVSLNGTFTIARAKGAADREVIMRNYKYGASVSGPSLSKTEDIEGEPEYYYYKGTEESSTEKLENVTPKELPIGDYWVEARYELKSNPNYYFITAKKKFQVKDHIHEWNYKKDENTGIVTATCDVEGNCENRTVELKLDVTETSEYEAEPKEKRVRVVSSNGSSINLDTLDIIPVFTYIDAVSGAKETKEPTDAGQYKYEVVFTGKESVSFNGVFTIKRAKQTPDREVVMGNYKYGEKVSGSSLSKTEGVETCVYRYYRGNEETALELLPASVELSALLPGSYFVEAEYTLGSDKNHYYVTTKKKFQVEAHVHEWSYVRNEATNTVVATCTGAGICENKTVELKLKNTEPFPYEKEPKERRVVVLANGDDLNRNSELGIKAEFLYDKNEAGEALKEEPRDAGKHLVTVIFGGNEKAFLSGNFTIEKLGQKSPVPVIMKGYPYGAEGKAQYPELGIETKTLTYYYEGDDETGRYEFNFERESFNSTSLDVGKYSIWAVYTQAADENYIYTTEKTEFEVEKGTLNGIKVIMPDYDLECKQPPSPSLSLNGSLSINEENVSYHYNTEKRNPGDQGDPEWPIWKAARKNKGKTTYYMYAKITNIPNYNDVITQTKKFIVYPDHKWQNMPKTLTSKTQKKKISCTYCQEKRKVTLPKRTVSVVMGKPVTLTSKNCTFKKGELNKVKNKKWKKYLKKNFYVTEGGKITAKAKPDYYSLVKSPVPITVTAYGRTYKMNVKLKIPGPNVKITQEKIRNGSVSGYKFIFKYKVPKADRIQVTMKGETPNIKRDLNRYVSKPKSTSESYLGLSDGFLKKLNNKVVFKIQAKYGSNQSETVTITKKVNKR